MKQIIGETKYNNRLIYIMVQDQEICPLFKQFLEEGAEKWIEDSKLSNKEIHKEGIELYLNLINKKKGDQKKISLKKEDKNNVQGAHELNDEDELFE